MPCEEHVLLAWRAMWVPYGCHVLTKHVRPDSLAMLHQACKVPVCNCLAKLARFLGTVFPSLQGTLGTAWLSLQGQP